MQLKFLHKVNFYNVINRSNTSTESVVENFFASESLNLLKAIRFDIGAADRNKLKEMLYLDDIYNRSKCNSEQDYREDIIQIAIKTLNEL
jgi:hypothetical protein